MKNQDNRAYLCLSKQIYTFGNYTLLPLRHHDQEPIRVWRNEQIAILRQKKPLTQPEQAAYYSTVVAKLFEIEQPNQLLFSFLLNDVLIGYGGLVHISWEDKNAEISFLLETNRNKNIDLFKHDWSIYLQMLKEIAFEQLHFQKIYTYAYDIRPHLIDMLLDNGFVEEARLHNHVFIENEFHAVLIHAFFNPTKSQVHLRPATAADIDLFFAWTNEASTRANSYNNTPVPYDNHVSWFLQKIANTNTYMYVLYENTGVAAGQIRFDVDNTLNEAVISYAIGEQHRGKKYGSIILEQGISTFLHDYGQKITIIGFVKEENLASKHLFSKLGFTALVADNLPKSIKFVL